MKTTIRRTALAAAFAACAALAGTATAQQSGLVNVSLSNVDVLNNLARDLKVNVSQIPVNVQVPVGIAAAVCEVNANVLAQQKKAPGGSTCAAKNNSDALNRIVQRQLVAQAPTTTP